MILDEIIANKRLEVARLKEERFKGKDLAVFAKRLVPPRNFLAAFPPGQVSLIAEIKRASPSSGDINANLVPASLAKAYQDGGAAALSVLTDEKYFKGRLEDLIYAKQATTIPVLRKDFIVDEIQVYESRIAGADALLLIVKALAEEELSRLLKITEELGMQALVEVHTEKEVEIALRLNARLIGINNRDLDTFQVDFNQTIKLVDKFPELKQRILVSESGIDSCDQVRALKEKGVSAILVGTALVSSPNIAAKIEELKCGH